MEDWGDCELASAEEAAAEDAGVTDEVTAEERGEEETAADEAAEEEGVAEETAEERAAEEAGSAEERATEEAAWLDAADDENAEEFSADEIAADEGAAEDSASEKAEETEETVEDTAEEEAATDEASAEEEALLAPPQAADGVTRMCGVSTPAPRVFHTAAQMRSTAFVPISAVTLKTPDLPLNVTGMVLTTVRLESAQYTVRLEIAVLSPYVPETRTKFVTACPLVGSESESRGAVAGTEELEVSWGAVSQAERTSEIRRIGMEEKSFMLTGIVFITPPEM